MSTATTPASDRLPLTRPLVTRQEAAEYLGVNKQTLAVWASTGRYGLPYVRVGAKALYRVSDLDAWLASRTRTQTD